MTGPDPLRTFTACRSVRGGEDRMRLRWSWIILIGFVLAGCNGRGSPISAEEAEEHFRIHQGQYAQVVALVDECRPSRTGSSFKRVWADGSNRSGLHCSRGVSDVGSIENALHEAGAISLYYGTSDGPESLTPQGTLTSVDIEVYSSGMATSGRSIKFVYSADAMNAAPPDHRDGDYIIARRLVGSPPHHWYWESGSN